MFGARDGVGDRGDRDLIEVGAEAMISTSEVGGMSSFVMVPIAKSLGSKLSAPDEGLRLTEKVSSGSMSWSPSMISIGMLRAPPAGKVIDPAVSSKSTPAVAVPASGKYPMTSVLKLLSRVTVELKSASEVSALLPSSWVTSVIVIVVISSSRTVMEATASANPRRSP